MPRARGAGDRAQVASSLPRGRWPKPALVLARRPPPAPRALRPALCSARHYSCTPAGPEVLRPMKSRLALVCTVLLLTSCEYVREQGGRRLLAPFDKNGFILDRRVEACGTFKIMKTSFRESLPYWGGDATVAGPGPYGGGTAIEPGREGHTSEPP